MSTAAVAERSFSVEPSGKEPIRLVIWDLDNTYWTGTLTEGGIHLRDDTQNIVVKLAHRGIISSICSKNDHDSVQKILSDAGVWDYFVFPTINWEAKGPRLEALVDELQLRPGSVLFIDDNPVNLAEAVHFMPELQTATEAFIPRMLESPLLKGKDDRQLKRLAQYRQMQTRKSDAAASGQSVDDFLRRSNIQVFIDHDLEAHASRAIELINRTNQLNFTKLRLSEDVAAATAELMTQVRTFNVQAGLLRVTDNYGDHGIVGLYVLDGARDKLIHFCFSCRILGMRVETWLYRKLGKPHLSIIGEVRSNPVMDCTDIDWINYRSQSVAELGDREGASTPQLDWIVVKGGCDLSAVSHYLRFSTAELIGEFNTGRHGLNIRNDHSCFLHHAFHGVDPGVLRELERLGYAPGDFESALLTPRSGMGFWILSFWTDSCHALYRHRELGCVAPFLVPGARGHLRNAQLMQTEDIPVENRSQFIVDALQTIKNDWAYIGLIDGKQFKDNLRPVLESAPVGTIIVLVKRSESYFDKRTNVRHFSQYGKDLNIWMTELSEEFSNVLLMDISDYVQNDAEVQGWLHFDRVVYMRLAEDIKARIVETNTSKEMGRAAPPL
jgi:FkbH-like protein